LIVPHPPQASTFLPSTLIDIQPWNIDNAMEL
jgi:hypothetical protein